MIKLKLKLIILIGIVLLISNTTNAQISAKEVDKLVENAMSKFYVAGVAVAIVKDGEIVHSKGYGVKSVETKEKVNEHTQFSIASNSKAFTTAALSILVDEGKLSWTDKVIDYIPEFRMYNPYVTENFIIQDLLSHRSGLGLGAGDLMFFPDGNNFTIDDVLTVYQYFKPESPFRTKFSYNNLLYIVAGEIISEVSGLSWEEFVKIRIIEPLNMDNSYSSLSQIIDRGNLATPHSTIDNELVAISQYDDMVNGAAAGIYANVDDLTIWMLVQLNNGKYGDSLEKELFSEYSQREMWKIHTTLNPSRSPRNNSHFAGYGLGWGLSDNNGNMIVSHTGGMPGMLSKTVLIPDLNLGVVVLTNTSDGGAGVFASVSNTIVDSYLGLEDNEWVDKYSTYFNKRQKIGDSITMQVWETVNTADDDHINPEDYIGVYNDIWFGKVEVYLRDYQLWFRSYRSPKLTGPMYYYKANTFAIKWEYQDMNADAFAIFSLDEEGKTQSIKMKGISPNIDFSFDFQDLDMKRVAD
ncbi:MAG: serine hydrolase [Bacteroidetes bacterium]|nr:serine hydrolase [Bacteroidota bacterium]MBL6942723.1 serine hydrolase [Bacteroidales bacterium]